MESEILRKREQEEEDVGRGMDSEKKMGNQSFFFSFLLLSSFLPLPVIEALIGNQSIWLAYVFHRRRHRQTDACTICTSYIPYVWVARYIGHETRHRSILCMVAWWPSDFFLGGWPCSSIARPALIHSSWKCSTRTVVCTLNLLATSSILSDSPF